MRLPDRVDGVAPHITDAPVLLISLVVSCCFSVVLVAMGIKFPWFRRQLRLGSMAQMTATVNANAKKETAARATNIPSSGVFKRWNDEEAGPPPEPLRVTLRKDRPAPPPPQGARSTSLPPTSRKTKEEALLARKSEMPARASVKETSAAKSARKAEEERVKAARKAEEERVKEGKRQEVLRRKSEEKRRSKEYKRSASRRRQPPEEVVEAVNVVQQPSRPPPLPQNPPPSRAEEPVRRVEEPAGREVEPVIPASAMVVSGTEEKGKKKDKKKKKKKELANSAPPTRRNPNATSFQPPSNPLAVRRPSPPPAATNEVVFQKMNSSTGHLNMAVPQSPRPTIKSQSRPRQAIKKKAPLGKPVSPPRIYTPPNTPPPGYQEEINSPRLGNLAFENDGVFSFRMPDAPEPIEVHPSFLALPHGGESDECDA